MNDIYYMYVKKIMRVFNVILILDRDEHANK